jgi:ABC-type branched-chain amino acid transport systems, periplasmic component
MAHVKSVATQSIVLLVVGLLVGAAIGYLIYPSVNPAQITTVTAPEGAGGVTTVTVPVGTPVLTGEIKFGAILTLSGDLRTFGENHRAALELAKQEINNWLASFRPGLTVTVEYEDTQTKGSIALEKVQSFVARGIKFIIGPLSSGELRAIKSYVDEQGIVVVSQSSTAVDLAVKDRIFRFTPNDNEQAPALARLIYDLGIRYIIPVWRDDPWGNGLQKGVTTRFTQLGGAVDEGIKYSPEEKSFVTQAAALKDKVESALTKYPKSQVAVHLIAFEEAAVLMKEAAKYDVLRQVRWFGSDGTAGSGDLLKDPEVAKFCYDTKFLNTIFAPTQSEKYNKVREHIMQTLNREPDSYSYAIYDILWVLVKAILFVENYDPAAVAQVLPQVAETYFGASGWVLLDKDTGDRIGTAYDIWAINEVSPGKYEWVRVAYWVKAEDKVTFLPGYSYFAS